MLILSRKPGEAILIDGGIRIVLIACDQRSARIGIEAPSSVGIVREEIVIEVADENRRASDAARASEMLNAMRDVPSTDAEPGAEPGADES